MPLSEQDVSKVNAWFQMHGVRPECPQCASLNQSLESHLSLVPSYSPRTGRRGAGVPILSVICNDCAHISLFAAVPMGLA